MQPAHPRSKHPNAPIYCADDAALPDALFGASHAAPRNPKRNFDILICSPTPLSLPQYFPGLGIKPVQLVYINRSIHRFKLWRLGGRAYMNGRVRLIDIATFNSLGLLERFLSTNKAMAPFIHHDQSLANLTLRHEWAELHLHWSRQGTLWFHRFTAATTPREIAKGYAKFMAKHFPDKAWPGLARHSCLGAARIALKKHYDDIRLTPRLKSLSRRFRDDLEMLT